jgi:hypothetical protein
LIETTYVRNKLPTLCKKFHLVLDGLMNFGGGRDAHPLASEACISLAYKASEYLPPASASAAPFARAVAGVLIGLIFYEDLVAQVWPSFLHEKRRQIFFLFNYL